MYAMKPTDSHNTITISCETNLTSIAKPQCLDERFAVAIQTAGDGPFTFAANAKLKGCLNRLSSLVQRVAPRDYQAIWALNFCEFGDIFLTKPPLIPLGCNFRRGRPIHLLA